MSGLVRVDLDYGHYGQGHFYTRSDRGAYEIPWEQFDRWEATTAAYQAMQAEMNALEEAAILLRPESDAQYAAKARAAIDHQDAKTAQAREEAQR